MLLHYPAYFDHTMVMWGDSAQIAEWSNHRTVACLQCPPSQRLSGMGSRRSSSQEKETGYHRRQDDQEIRPSNVGLSDQLSRTWQTHGVYLFHKPQHYRAYARCSYTPKEKNLLHHLPLHMWQQHIPHLYIGETKRTLSTRFNPFRARGPKTFLICGSWTPAGII